MQFEFKIESRIFNVSKCSIQKKNKKNFIFIFQNIKKTLYLWYRNEQLKNEQNENVH